ncbi:uncharacterized protein LOC135842393 [Planococcus citri]|uniref:uncharacterized protein LOC135842393 n=1 Tax=Planococcus citri TaxID=170843 RepID=UPI0031F92677
MMKITKISRVLHLHDHRRFYSRVLTRRILPFHYLIFEKTFGRDPESKPLLKSLINSIVREEDRITNIEKLSLLEKQLGFHLEAVQERESPELIKRFNIEIQVAQDENYDTRAVQSMSKYHSDCLDQLGPRDSYKNSSMPKTISIHLSNHSILPAQYPFHTEFILMERNTKMQYPSECVTMHVLEFDKCKADVDSLKTPLEEWWAFFMKTYKFLHADEVDLIKTFKTSEVRTALQNIEVMRFTDYELNFYDSHLRHVDMIKMEATMEMAQRMIEIGSDNQFIAKITGLEFSVIEEMRNS